MSQNLCILRNKSVDGKNEFLNHTTSKIIHKKYPGIVRQSFKFGLVSDNDLEKEILDTIKSSIYRSIPAAILKQCVNVYLRHLTNSIH